MKKRVLKSRELALFRYKIPIIVISCWRRLQPMILKNWWDWWVVFCSRFGLKLPSQAVLWEDLHGLCEWPWMRMKTQWMPKSWKAKIFPTRPWLPVTLSATRLAAHNYFSSADRSQQLHKRSEVLNLKLKWHDIFVRFLIVGQSRFVVLSQALSRTWKMK